MAERVLVAGFCRRGGCRRGFTVVTVADAASGVSRFCGPACERLVGAVHRVGVAASRARSREQARGRELTRPVPVLAPDLGALRLLVGGFCHRPGCGAAFTLVRSLLGFLATGPGPTPAQWCSATCRRQGWRARVAARRQREAELAAAALRCPTCWARPRSHLGMVVCPACFTTMRSSCEGKKRHLLQTDAEDAARHRSRVAGRTLVAYPCEVCGHWHIGREVPPWRGKQTRLVREVFVARVGQAALVRVLMRWDPWFQARVVS